MRVMWATHLHLMTITNREINLKSLGGFVYPSPLLYNRILEGIRMGKMKIVEKVGEKCRFATDMGIWGP